MTKSKTLVGALHNSWTPPGIEVTIRNYEQRFSETRKKLYCKHGKRVNACSECYKDELKKKGLSTWLRKTAG